jgi:hypothetical protein
MQRAKDDKDTMPVRTSGVAAVRWSTTGRPTASSAVADRVRHRPGQTHVRERSEYNDPALYSHEELDIIVPNQLNIYSLCSQIFVIL